MAVVEDLVATVQDSVGATAKRIHDRLAEGPLTLDEGELLLSALVEKMVGFLVGTGQAQLRAAFVIRELMHPSAAFDLLYQGYMEQVHTTITRLVATLLEDKPNSQTSILRAHALLGQIVMFGAGRELIRRRADWDEVSEENLQQITKVVTETFLASIRGMRADRGIPPI